MPAQRAVPQPRHVDVAVLTTVADTYCRTVPLLVRDTVQTFTGVKAMECLLASKGGTGHKQGPILVLAYTNHALDQFLTALLRVTSKIIRMGSRSEDPKLKAMSLRSFRDEYGPLDDDKRARLAAAMLYRSRSRCASDMLAALGPPMVDNSPLLLRSAAAAGAGASASAGSSWRHATRPTTPVGTTDEDTEEEQNFAEEFDREFIERLEDEVDHSDDDLDGVFDEVQRRQKYGDKYFRGPVVDQSPAAAMRYLAAARRFDEARNRVRPCHKLLRAYTTLLFST